MVPSMYDKETCWLQPREALHGHQGYFYDRIDDDIEFFSYYLDNNEVCPTFLTEFFDQKENKTT